MDHQPMDHQPLQRFYAFMFRDPVDVKKLRENHFIESVEMMDPSIYYYPGVDSYADWIPQTERLKALVSWFLENRADKTPAGQLCNIPSGLGSIANMSLEDRYSLAVKQRDLLRPAMFESLRNVIRATAISAHKGTPGIQSSASGKGDPNLRIGKLQQQIFSSPKPGTDTFLQDSRLPIHQIHHGFDIGHGFRTDGHIGMGATGAVLKVRLEAGTPHITYACKIMVSKGFEDKILREVSAVKRIQTTIHRVEHIAQFSQSDKFCMVMEYATFNLGSLLATLGQNMPHGLAGDMLRQTLFTWIDCLLSAIDIIHESGIRHRDIKPANILVDSSLRVVIADFGLAFSAGKATGNSYTSSGGSWYYAPPEAWGPDTDATSETLQTGQAGDVFSLGCVFFEILRAVSTSFLSAGFPEVHKKGYACSLAQPDFFRVARSVEEDPARLETAGTSDRYFGLTKEILEIVLDKMMTTLDMRKPAYSAHVQVKIVMAEKQFVSCCLKNHMLPGLVED